MPQGECRARHQQLPLVETHLVKCEDLIQNADPIESSRCLPADFGLVLHGRQGEKAVVVVLVPLELLLEIRSPTEMFDEDMLHDLVVCVSRPTQQEFAAWILAVRKDPHRDAKTYMVRSE